MNPRWHFHRHTSRTLRVLKYTVWLLACGSCGVDTKYGGNEVSVSAEEAQQLGVWVQSLRPDKAGWAVRDTPVVALQQAWLERCWTHAKGEEKPHVLPGLQLVLVLRQGQALPDRYRACLPQGQEFWRANQQLYLPLEDTVQRSRYVMYLQQKESAPDRQVSPLDSLVLQTP
jgi:hypothetical protein